MLSVDGAQAAKLWARIVDDFEALDDPSASELDAVADALRLGFAGNFEQESADGDPWAALRPVTVQERIALGFPGEHPILERTGRYRRSWTDPASADHIQQFDAEPFGWSLAVGSQDERVEELELGTGYMVGRPVLPISDAALSRIAQRLDAITLASLTP